MHAFNPLDCDPSQGQPNWPLGKHPVIIESHEVKGTKDGSNGMLVLNLRIIDGPEAGFTGPYRLNLYHSNEDAVKIAHRQLSAVCHVVGVFQLGPDGTRVDYLYNKQFVIEVGLQRGDEAKEKGYTEIKRVFDMNGNEPQKGGGGGQNQQRPQGFGGQGQGGGQQQAQQGQQNGQQGGAQAWGGQNNGNGGNQQQGGNGGGWGGNQGGGNGPDPNAGQQGGGQGGGWGQQGNQQADQGQQGGNSGGGGWQQQNQQGNGGGGNGGPSWGQRR